MWDTRKLNGEMRDENRKAEPVYAPFRMRDRTGKGGMGIKGV